MTLRTTIEPWLIEAILRKEWGAARNGFGLQTGVMNVPFSLEHTGPAWPPEYTITASALNSWLWEDLNLAGVEAEWWRITGSGIRLGALVGVGFRSRSVRQTARDPRLGARRWAERHEQRPRAAQSHRPHGIFDERDGRPCRVYAGSPSATSRNSRPLKSATSTTAVIRTSRRRVAHAVQHRRPHRCIRIRASTWSRSISTDRSRRRARE